MKRQILGLLLAGALCGVGSICKADGVTTGDATPKTVEGFSAMKTMINSSPSGALSILPTLEDALNLAGKYLLLSQAEKDIVNSRQEGASTLAAGIIDNVYLIPLAMRQITSDSIVADKKVGSIFLEFQVGKEGAKSAAQVSQSADEFQVQISLINYAQQQRLIDQNDQIIDLLKQLASKK